MQLRQQALDIVVLKPGSGGTDLVWVEGTPQQQNTLTWTDNLLVYTSNTPVQVGAVITPTSETPAQTGEVYSAQSSGLLTNAGRGAPGQIQVTNDDSNTNVRGSMMITTGLAQAYTFNGQNTANPFCAESVMFNAQASFRPDNTVRLVIASNVLPGAVPQQMFGPALTVSMGSQTSKDIAYQNGTFVET
ncbi:hypothetical protein [uncultured Tateyamaria sp.]|uniref:hypothetical protein n=1 Tax=Tateyamaria sp. 1078 TaxID=3417464 RepID=UPI00262CF7ED|nr:hypothetical protein [uncultured Tateyamaria sp.]